MFYFFRTLCYFLKQGSLSFKNVDFEILYAFFSLYAARIWALNARALSSIFYGGKKEKRWNACEHGVRGVTSVRVGELKRCRFCTFGLQIERFLNNPDFFFFEIKAQQSCDSQKCPREKLFLKHIRLARRCRQIGRFGFYFIRSKFWIWNSAFSQTAPAFEATQFLKGPFFWSANFDSFMGFPWGTGLSLSFALSSLVMPSRFLKWLLLTNDLFISKRLSGCLSVCLPN